MSGVQGSRQFARLAGTIRFYFGDEGRGYIHAGGHDYRFGLTDIVGTRAPAVGDRVQFSPQLDQQAFRARRIVLDANPQYIHLAAPDAQYRSVALNLRPASDAIVRQRRSAAAAASRPLPTAPLHRRCFDCQKLVVPRRVKARPGVLGQRDSAQWKHYCPRCKSRLDHPGRRRRLRWRGALLGGLALYWVGQIWWF